MPRHHAPSSRPTKEEETHVHVPRSPRRRGCRRIVLDGIVQTVRFYTPEYERPGGVPPTTVPNDDHRAQDVGRVGADLRSSRSAAGAAGLGEPLQRKAHEPEQHGRREDRDARRALTSRVGS